MLKIIPHFITGFDGSKLLKFVMMSSNTHLFDYIPLVNIERELLLPMIPLVPLLF